MSGWQPIIFFEGEDPEALKLKFIQLSAKHKNVFHPHEVARHVFAGLKEPHIRSMQAADVWSNDIEVVDAIRELMLLGDNDTVNNKTDLQRIARQIANDPKQMARDRIHALEFIAQTEGMIVKPIELRGKSDPDNRKSGLPIFMVSVDNDADKPNPA